YEMNCTDGFDNDQDGVWDCSDVDCRGRLKDGGMYIYGLTPYIDLACPFNETKGIDNVVHNGSDGSNWCNDTIDNDLDSLIDCSDSDCYGVFGPQDVICAPNEYFSWPATCDDGGDNDDNGFTDCFDSACNAKGVTCNPCPQAENVTMDTCSDGIDTDADGNIDCADSDCVGLVGPLGVICEPAGETLCNDGLDNDADGKIDCMDFDCSSEFYCPQNEKGPGLCKDGMDNDFDSNIDCADSDCVNTTYCLSDDKTYPSFASVLAGGTNITYSDVVRLGDNVSLTYYKEGLSGQTVLFSVGSTEYPYSLYGKVPYDLNTFMIVTQGPAGMVKTVNSNTLQAEGDSFIGNINVTLTGVVDISTNLGLKTLDVRSSITGIISKIYRNISILENEAPYILNITPVNLSQLLTNDITFTANVSDFGVYDSGIDHCEFSNDTGVTWYLADNCSYTFTNLSVGDTTIQVRTIDGAGNPSSVNETTITVLDYPVYENALNLSRNYYQGVEEIEILVNFTSGAGFNNNASGCVVALVNKSEDTIILGSVNLENSSGKAVCSGNLSVEDIFQEYYDLYVYVYDKNSIRGESTRENLWICYYKVDGAGYVCKDPCDLSTSEPVINYVWMNDTIIKNDTYVHVVVNVSGQETDLIKYVFADFGSLFWNGTFWTGDIQIDNDEIMNISAVNMGDLIGYNNMTTYVIDNDPAYITNILIPVENSNITGASVNIIGQANDTISFVSNTTFYIKNNTMSYFLGYNSSGDGINYSVSLDTMIFADGVYNISMKSYDAADNVNISSNRTVYVDNTPPVVQFTQPLVLENISGSVNVMFNITDVVTFVSQSTINITSDGTVISGFDPIVNCSSILYGYSCSFLWNTTFESDGVVVLNVSGNNYAGIMGYNTRNVIVDNTMPYLVNITVPVVGENVTGIINIYADANDILTGIKNVSFYMSNSSWGLVVGTDISGLGISYNISYDTSLIGDGMYNISAMASDFSGNYNISSNVSVVVDNTPPVALFTQPILDANLSGILLVIFNITDTTTFVKQNTINIESAGTQITG
ncbi:hypothetical protein GQ473_00810, partial [archaeon]|nr:hypothetical protein [archaeon]